MEAIVGLLPDTLTPVWTPFGPEDEAAAVDDSMNINWLRELDRAVFVPHRTRMFERAVSKKMRAVYYACWLAVRGDLDDERVVTALESLAEHSAKIMPMSALKDLSASAPTGLFVLSKALSGRPTQRPDRVGVADTMSSFLAPVESGRAPFTDTRRMLRETATPLNTKMYAHKLSDLMSHFSRLTADLSQPLTGDLLDAFGALLYQSFESCAYYGNPTLTFESAMMKEDHDSTHRPIVFTWNVLLNRAIAQEDVTMQRVILALYSILRNTGGVSNAPDYLVLYSLLGYLFDCKWEVSELESSVLMPSWMYGLELATADVVALREVLRTSFPSSTTPSFRRLVMESQYQLPNLIMRRAKCSYSNVFVCDKE